MEFKRGSTAPRILCIEHNQHKTNAVVDRKQSMMIKTEQGMLMGGSCHLSGTEIEQVGPA